MMRSTSRPAILPASRVACRCESLKYAGTVMMASVTSSPRKSSANDLISISTNAEISSGEYSLSRTRTFTSPLFAATMLYGSTFFAWPTSSDSNLRPMRRLMAKTVLNGLVIACRFAICPTSRSPSSVNPTTEGVVRLPSRFGLTCGVVTSTTATQEFVVPRSIPRILAIRFDGKQQWLLVSSQERRRSDPSSFRPSHRHLHHRRPQQAVVEEVALLQDGGDGVRRDGIVFLAHDGFVDVGIERHARLFDRSHAVFLQDVEHLLVNQQDAFVKVVALGGVIERAVEVVEDRQEVLQHPRHCVLVELPLFALAAAAEVFEVREQAQIAVAELLRLLIRRAGPGRSV